MAKLNTSRAKGRNMVTATGHPWLPILSAIVFVVIFAVAVRIMWREWGPEFQDEYGEARGREFLALFLVSFPAFVVAHVMFKRARRRNSPPDDL